MTHVPHPDEEQRKVCEKLREPSQEAVELIRAEVSRRRGACYCNVDPHCSVCREAEEVVAIARPALRAVEQRTRLETLERAAELVKWLTDVPVWSGPRGFVMLGVARWECILDETRRLRSEIASIQPREAPKAEEPKR